MKTIEYRDTCDRSKWPGGEWDGEPDKIQWLDVATGLPCLIRRNPLGGNLCGYVGVSKGHPFFGKPYDDCNVDVHGGLSYSAPCTKDASEAEGICHKVEPGEDDCVWWLGFDCGHHMDLVPGMGRYMDIGGTYRNVDYVKAECADLARQLSAMRAT